MVTWLDGPEAMSTGHGDLEARLSIDGRERQRLLLVQVVRRPRPGEGSGPARKGRDGAAG